MIDLVNLLNEIYIISERFFDMNAYIIYLIGQLETWQVMSGVLMGFGFLGFLVTSVLLFAMSDDEDDVEVDVDESSVCLSRIGLSRWRKICLWFSIVFFLMQMTLPSRNTAIAMYVFPKISQNISLEELNTEAKEIYKIAKHWVITEVEQQDK
jgi:hypothetical protein